MKEYGIEVMIDAKHKANNHTIRTEKGKGHAVILDVQDTRGEN